MIRLTHEWQWAVIAAAAVLVVGLGAGAAQAAVRGAVNGGQASTSPGDAGNTALALTGTPPSTEAGAFRHGVKLAWKTTADAVGQGEVNGDLDVVTSTGTTWMIVDNDRGGDGSVIEGVDASTGRVLWRHVEELPLGCAPRALDGSAFCFSSGFEGDRTLASVSVVKISLADGTSAKKVGLDSLGIGGGNMAIRRIVTLGGAVVLETLDASTPYVSRFAKVLKLPEDLSAVSWTATVDSPRDSQASNWPSVAREEHGMLVLSDAYVDTVLDFGTGDVVETSGAGSTDVTSDGQIVVSGADRNDVTIRPASSASVITPATNDRESVDFSASPEAPVHPVLVESGPDGSVSTRAYADDGVTVAWPTAVTTVGFSQQQKVYGAYTAGRVAVADSAGHVTQVDAKTGQVQWTNAYNTPDRSDSGAAFTRPDLFFAADGTLVVADSSPGTTDPAMQGFDPTTGALEWTIDEARPVAGQARNGRAIAVRTLDSAIGALVGDSTPARASTATPAGLPSCPGSMSPVSWSVYPGGHVLLCEGSGTYVARYERSGTERSCTALAFEAGGYVLTCGDDERVRVSGSGAMVQISTTSSSWVQPASQAWAAASGSERSTHETGFGSSPAKIAASCPTGSVPLSLSTWHDGWLLICGTDALHAASFVYRDASTSGKGMAMTYDAGRYCGTDARGESVCVSDAPAVVSFTPKGGATTQRSVAGNYFATTGTGGEGQGTGAYGVPAPQDTADDEVRYLVQILQKSQTGRAEVSDLVADLLRCQVDADGLSTAAAVESNRQDLLDALASTPVDRVPNGSRLVTELTAALTVSLQADEQYAQAAQQIASGDCTTGLSTTKAAISVADSTDALKQTFVDDWNATIAGKYDKAPTFTEDTI